MIKLVITSFFLKLLLSFQALALDNNLIQETCKKSSQQDPNLSYSFCITSLQSAPGINEAKDLHNIGLITIDLIRNNVTSTQHRIKTLLKSKKLDPFLDSCLNDCYKVYSDAVVTIKKVKKDYKAKVYADVNIEVSSIMEASSTCENGFNEKEGMVSPLTKRNKDTFQLAAIALSILNIVHNPM